MQNNFTNKNTKKTYQKGKTKVQYSDDTKHDKHINYNNAEYIDFEDIDVEK